MVNDMPTIDDCMRCARPCPQAKMAHQIALGRMYATKELLSYVKKVDSGQLVEVVRCKDCKWRNADDDCTHEWWRDANGWCAYVEDDMFCSYEERDGDGNG